MELQPETDRKIANWKRVLAGAFAVICVIAIVYDIGIAWHAPTLVNLLVVLLNVINFPYFACVAVTGSAPRRYLCNRALSQPVTWRSLFGKKD